MRSSRVLSTPPLKMAEFCASANKSQYENALAKKCVDSQVYVFWLSANHERNPSWPDYAATSKTHREETINGKKEVVNTVRYNRMKPIAVGDTLYMNGKDGLYRGKVKALPVMSRLLVTDPASIHFQLSKERIGRYKKEIKERNIWYEENGVENSHLEVVIPVDWELVTREPTAAQKKWCSKHATVFKSSVPFPN